MFRCFNSEIRVMSKWHIYLFYCRVNEENEEPPMSRSFSVEDLLDEVEKICYDASGTSKVRDKHITSLHGPVITQQLTEVYTVQK